MAIGGPGSWVVVLGLGGMIPLSPWRLLYCLWAHFLGLQLGLLCTLVEIPPHAYGASEDAPTGLQSH